MKTESRNKLDEKLSDALSRAVLSETESSFADRDAFQNWLEEGARRQLLARRRKIRRIGFAAAAVFLCAVLLTGSLLLTDVLPPSLQALLSPGEGLAVPDVNSNVESGSGNVVIGGDGNGNTGTWTATFASYDEIPEKYREQIVWFEEMPEGYELVEIEITQNLNNLELVTTYNFNHKKNLRIKQTTYYHNVDKITIFNQYDKKIVMGEFEFYKKISEQYSTYSMTCKNDVVHILDYLHIEQEKIEAMIASIKIGWSMK